MRLITIAKIDFEAEPILFKLIPHAIFKTASSDSDHDVDVMLDIDNSVLPMDENAVIDILGMNQSP